jgi:hypothetical protein
MLNPMVEMMKGQLLIVLVERLGGDVTIPVAEIDNTGQKMMTMELIDQESSKPKFRFKIAKKN